MCNCSELMPRKPRSFRIDERVFEVIKTLAERSGVEPQQFLENYFFARGKELGLIAPNEQPLGETRGGKRPGAGKPKRPSTPEEPIDSHTETTGKQVDPIEQTNVLTEEAIEDDNGAIG